MKTYIIHVKNAHERKKHILKQLANKELDFSFITDGDKNELNNKLLNKYFIGDMASISNATSCAYKHILSYEKLIQSKDNLAMIIEDDLRFYSNFNKINDFIKEISLRELNNFIISLEDSYLKYIPKSERKKDTNIYKKKNRQICCLLFD